MPLPKVIQRELEVAFSRRSQALWVRVMKYIALGLLIYYLRGSDYLWPSLFILLAVALLLHFWVRYKTKGWTRSFWLWKSGK
jgi:uncharacterized membrane protein